MSTETVAKSQRLKDLWGKVMDSHVERLNSWYTDASELESVVLRRSTEVIDGFSRLYRDFFDYSLQITASWRKSGIQAVRCVADLITLRS